MNTLNEWMEKLQIPKNQGVSYNLERQFVDLPSAKKHKLLEQCIRAESPEALIAFSQLAASSLTRVCSVDLLEDTAKALIDAKHKIGNNSLVPYMNLVNQLILENNTLAGKALSAWNDHCHPQSVCLMKVHETKEALASVMDGYMNHGCDSDIFIMIMRKKEPVLDLCWDLLAPTTQKLLKRGLGRANPDQYIRDILERNPVTRCALSRDSLVGRLDQPSSEPLPQKNPKKL